MHIYSVVDAYMQCSRWSQYTVIFEDYGHVRRGGPSVLPNFIDLSPCTAM